MRLTVPTTEFTEASRIDQALIEIDRRTGSRSESADGASNVAARRPAGSGVTLTGTAPAPVIATQAPVTAGRRYRIDIDFTAWADGSGTTGLETRISTAMNATPDTASPVLRYFPFVLPGGTVWDQLAGFAEYAAETDGVLGLLLWVSGAAGRNYGIVGNDAVEARMLVTELGRDS